jgi:hypothetical protein
MQTFLPYVSFEMSARVLDRQRLGKQRVECMQILQCLTNKRQGWKNHPAVKMWDGHIVALGLYGLAMCEEWIRRGYKDTCTSKIKELVEPYNYGPAYYPFWLGNPHFHLSHKSNLIRKLPSHYRPIFGDSIPDNLPYFWPTKQYELQTPK